MEGIVISKKGLIVVLLLIGTLMLPYSALAAREPGSTLLSNTNVERSIQSTLYLKVWSTSITQLDGNFIQITGDTEAYEDVDIVRVTLYLQYWNGVEWLDAAYIDTFTNNDSHYVYGAKNATVESGYHYRTKGVHYVNKSGSYEQVNSYSGSIYIE
jgi:hypothetical protein